MPDHLEEIVKDNIEDIGVDAVLERQKEATAGTSRWEGWVALSSSLLAVLSAITALYATFASDKASIAESQKTVIATYASGADATYHVMRVKIDMLKALGKPVDPADEATLKERKLQVEQYREKINASSQAGGYDYKTHDQLTIAVALFQVTILLGGLAVVVQRPKLWLFGMSFMVGGIWFMGRGLVDYFT